MGASGGADVESAFAAYLSDIRRPPRSLVVYNSWYDIQRGELTVPALVERQRTLQRELVDKRGARLDSLVIDDGWQNHQSIWEFDPVGFPHGFDELHNGLQGTGTQIGLWHPLTAMHYNLDVNWGAEQGYEVSPERTFFCLSAPKYNAALRAELRDKMRRYNINYFKHDFNAFDCRGEAHGHLPEAIYGREANVDAEIGMFKYLTSLRPDTYLNPSGGMWLSPWWLRYVDTVWMQHCGDHGYDLRVPALEPRDWEMTYRDARLHMNLQGDRVQFPVSAIMTIGIIDGKLNRLGGEHEPLDRWANNVMDNVCRGSMLKELYITPSLFSDAQWDVLARALRWQEQFLPQMACGRMIGGDPAAGEVYGYWHPGEEKSVLCLRNPGMDQQSFRWPVPGSGTWQPVVVYPYCQGLDPVPGGSALRLDLAPHELIVCELMRLDSIDFPVIKGCRYEVGPAHDGQVECRLHGPPGTETTYEVIWPRGASPARRRLAFPGTPAREATRESSHVEGGAHETWHWTGRLGGLDRAQFVALVGGRGARAVTSQFHLLLDDDEVPLTLQEGDGWLALWAELPPRSRGALQLRQDCPALLSGHEPFTQQPYELSARLLAETALAATDVLLDLPPDCDAMPVLPATPCAATVRRSDLLIEPTQKEWIGELVRLGPDDLAKATAAKLHISVFGSQGGDDYGRKYIVLNGARVAQVPVNADAANPDYWEEFTLDLLPEQTKLPRQDNVIVIETETPDCFKFSDVALALLRPKGAWASIEPDAEAVPLDEWVETIMCTEVFSTPPGWLHFEGTAFEQRSPEIKLRFP